MAVKHQKLKSLLVKIKGVSGKAGLKLNIKTNAKNKIMEFGPIILRYIEWI